MLVLGLVLIGAGAVLIVAAIFTAEVAGGQLEIIGVEVGALTLFLLGVVAGLAILWGFTIGKFGARRTLRHRRENQRLGELSDKLERHEAERRGDPDDRPDRR